MAALGTVAGAVRAGAAAGACALLSKLTGDGSSPSDAAAASPHGYTVHFLDDGDVRSRAELIGEALDTLRASRELEGGAPQTSEAKRRERTLRANDTWLKIYALIDYNHDHVLHKNEIIKGIQMVKHAWRMCAHKLWPADLLPKDQRIRLPSPVDRMCSRLDDVQALALGLADGDQLSWSKSTHFIQELEAHPGRKSFNRRYIISALCDEYLAAIVIPTLQAWLDVFTLIDWNHSRTLGFHELKQGLCACNTPEVNLMQNTADIKSTLSAARERLLKDKFFRIAGSMFEQSAVDRIISDPSASNLTCRQVATRHAKIWQRTCTADAESFDDEMDTLYDSLDVAISQDDVDKVEACVTRVRNRICHHLGVVRRHVSWLRNPSPEIFEGEWVSDNGDHMLIESSGHALVVRLGGARHYVDRVSRHQFTLTMHPGGGRHSLVTYSVVSGGEFLNETRSMGRHTQRWGRHQHASSPNCATGAESCQSTQRTSILSESTNSPPPINRNAVKLPPLISSSETRSLELDSSPLDLERTTDNNVGSGGCTAHAIIDEGRLSVDVARSADDLSAGAVHQCYTTEQEPMLMTPRAHTVLASMALDQGLTTEQYGILCGSVTQRTFQSGSVIYSEGDHVCGNSHFYIVQEGVVTSSQLEGTARNIGSGECFGELAIISGRPRQSTVVAKTEVQLLCVARSSFWAAVTCSAEHIRRAGRADAMWGEVKQQMQQVHDALQAQQRVSPKHGRLLQATEVDVMGFEAAAKDLNELAAATWRALIVSKQLVVTRQTTVNANSAGVPWRLNVLLVRVVRVFQANRVSRLKEDFGRHERIVTDVQARIRGFLERRRMRKDNEDALKVAASAADGDVGEIISKELDFWDWPRVLEHCYMWHANTEHEGDGPASSLCFPEILLQKDLFAKKMNRFKQAMQAWNELFTIMDTDSNGSVSPDELKCAMLAFSNMGLIAETPKMQPLNFENEPFVKMDEDPARPVRTDCCRKRTPKPNDGTGQVGPFRAGEVLLLGGEGVPMTGCWGIDVQFQIADLEATQENSFHCLVKAYSGDSIVAHIYPETKKVMFFIAPKGIFDEQTEIHQRLVHYFDELDEGRHLGEVEPDLSDLSLWYRLLIVGEPIHYSSEISSEEWAGNTVAQWDATSFYNAPTPGPADRSLRIGANISGARIPDTPLAASPASSIASFRTPGPSPGMSMVGSAIKLTNSAMKQRRPSIGDTLGGALPITPRMGSLPRRARRMSQVSLQGVTPITPSRSRMRTKSRRLSVCSAGSPAAESDGWSDDEDFESACTAQVASLQKLHVYVETMSNDQGSATLIHDRIWQGPFDFFDCYSLGNFYDAVCSRADDQLSWTMGPVRNFQLFGIDPDFKTELDAKNFRCKTWLDRALVLASSSQDGRCMQESAKKAGMVIHRGEDDDAMSPASGGLRTTSRGRLTPRGRPMRMSSRFALSPNTPRSPFPLLASPNVISPSPSPSPSSRATRAPRSSYRTLAEKLKSTHWHRKVEKKTDMAIEINRQPAGSLLWFKYRLVSERTPITCIQTNGQRTKSVEKPGCVWKNIWERDQASDVHSSGLVYRDDNEFQQEKARRTQRLVRSAYKALATDLKKNQNYWNIDGNASQDMLIDGAKFFLIRGEIARRDPGLNSMFTGKQVKHASRAVQRQLRVNTDQLQSIVEFFLLPPRACFNLLADLQRWACEWLCSQKQIELSAENQSTGATKSLLLYLFRTQRRAPRIRMLVATFLLWISCLFPLCAYIGSEISMRSHVHGIEIFINTSYYMWAVLCIATVVASDVRGIPGRVSYKQSALKAEVASKPCVMTKISDGMPITTSAMAIVQMVCRQHHGDEEDEEEEEGDEEEAGMDFSTKLLRLFWQQDDAVLALPWLQDQMQHDEELAELTSAQLNRLLVFEFQMKDPPRDKNDWIYNLNIAMQGVQSKIDMGRPKRSAKLLVGALAFIHGMLGLVHRFAFRGQPVLGQDIVEHAVAVIVCAGTTATSYIVYSMLLETGLKWWMVHLFLKQTHSTIVVEEAITSHLPCYMDLRNKGNLDSWYTARQYLQEETNVECFAHKDQLPIAIALAFCAGVSVNALTNYFGSNSGSADFSASPGILISLFNIVVIGFFLLIPMAAMEKINMETSVLLRKMNQVAVELGKSLEDNVYERMTDEERAETLEAFKAQTDPNYSSDQELTNQRLADLSRIATELQVREKLLMEQQFLLSIVQELRDTKSTKKIFGFAVDRNMLTKLFAGIGTCVYIILKEYLLVALPSLRGASADAATTSTVTPANVTSP